MATIKLAGENAIIIYFGEQATPELVEHIAFYTQQLLDALASVIIDVVPSYTSLMISYRLKLIDHHDFCNQVEQVLSNSTFTPSDVNSNLIEIPVYYGLDVGLDLESLLNDKGLELDEFRAIHSSKTYLVYAIGFSPAFAFLGKVDDAKMNKSDSAIELITCSIGCRPEKVTLSAIPNFLAIASNSTLLEPSPMIV